MHNHIPHAKKTTHAPYSHCQMPRKQSLHAHSKFEPITPCPGPCRGQSSLNARQLRNPCAAEAVRWRLTSQRATSRHDCCQPYDAFQQTSTLTQPHSAWCPASCGQSAQRQPGRLARTECRLRVLGVRGQDGQLRHLHASTITQAPAQASTSHSRAPGPQHS